MVHGACYNTGRIKNNHSQTEVTQMFYDKFEEGYTEYGYYLPGMGVHQFADDSEAWEYERESA